MAHIHIRKDWELKDLTPTDESIYQNRRRFIKQLGLLTISGLAGSHVLANSSLPTLKDAPSFHFKGEENYYPAKRNETYTLDRPMTEEYFATHYNNFYEFIHPDIKDKIYSVFKYVNKFDTSDWEFEVEGLAGKKGTFLLEDMIRALGTEERLYRFRCVERWAMAVPWTGFPLSALLKRFEPSNDAKYVQFVSAAVPKQMPGIKSQKWYKWPYTEALSIEEAMNPLAFMATGLYGKPLLKQNGAPMRVVVPWKYGFKNPKSIVKIIFTKERPATFWNQLQPDEYPFVSNVDPEKPHPRWSQEKEYLLPKGDWIPTQKYNGYGDLVAKLYP